MGDTTDAAHQARPGVLRLPAATTQGPLQSADWWPHSPIIFLVQFEYVAGGIGDLFAVVDVQRHVQSNQGGIVLQGRGAPH